MTWSIVARDPATGAVAVAVASAGLAIGARCPTVRAGVGAVAANVPALGPRVLDALASGAAPTAALAADVDRDMAQVHVVDARGRTAAHTGAGCAQTARHAQHDGYAVAGATLANTAVVDNTAKVYSALDDMPFAERLVAALRAGEKAGGDARGTRSAALLLAREGAAPVDLRVDDHDDPLAELSRLVALWRALGT